jgi:hypothetical protein
MKAWIYTVALPVLAVVAVAQDPQPTQPKQPSSTAPATQTPAKKDGKSADALPEMKTQTYSGTLMDASCAGGSTAAPVTPASNASANTSSADRSAGAGNGQSCSVSSSTSQFALKTKDGNTIRFDDVGNARVQEAMKMHKKWSESASASKPIHVKASGVLNGDKLTVMSID